MTIPAGLHLTEQTPDEAEFQQWKAAQGLTHDDAEFQAWKAQHAPSTRPDATSALPRNRENPTGDLQASSNLRGQAEHVGPAILGNLANIAQGIPGMEAVQAGARSVVRRQPYREALSDIRGQTENIPGPIKFAERAAGAAPLAGLLPGSPAVVGATLGGADPLLQADPDVGPGKRAVQGVVGAGVGYGVGKLADAATTKIRSMKAPARSENLAGREADRTATSGPLYTQAIAEGQGKTAADPAIQQWLQRPTIKSTLNDIRASDETGRLAHLADDSPEMLTKVFQNLSDTEGKLLKVVNNPNNPSFLNTSREALKNVRALKDEAVSAFSGPMPTFPEAVDTYASASKGMAAVKRGYKTMANTVSPAGGGVNEVERTPVGLARWSDRPTIAPDERTAAAQGVLAKVKELPSAAHVQGVPLVRGLPLPIPSKALRKAPDLLRTINAPGQSFIDLLTKLGLSTANSPFANP